MTSNFNYIRLREHKGHDVAIEANDDGAAVVCDECGDVVLSAIRSDGKKSEEEM